MQSSTNAARSAHGIWVGKSFLDVLHKLTDVKTIQPLRRPNLHRQTRYGLGGNVHCFSLSQRRSQDQVKTEDIPQWRPSRHDIVVNSLEGTLEAHRRTIQSVRESIEARKAEAFSWTPGVYQPVRPVRPSPYLPQELANDYNANLGGVSPCATKGNAVEEPNDVVQDEGRAERGYSCEDELDRLPSMASTINKSGVDENIEGLIKQPIGHWRYYKNSDEKLPEFARPWTSQLHSFDRDGMAQLQEEIEEFVRMMRFTIAQSKAVEISMSDIDDLLQWPLPSHSVTLHGSHATGLATPFSKVDISLNSAASEEWPREMGISPTHPLVKKANKRDLRFIANTLIKDGRFKVVRRVEGRIPLLVVEHIKSAVRLQMTIGMHYDATTEFTKYFLSEHRELRPLFVLLRMALQMRSLDNVMSGGIGAYPLLVMILTAITHPGSVPSVATVSSPPTKSDSSSLDSDSTATPALEPSAPAPTSLPALLLHVLDFWSKADTTMYGFAADPPRLFPKSHRSLPESALEPLDFPNDEAYREGIFRIARQNWARPRQSQYRNWTKYPFRLSLQDPASPANDLAIKSFGIRHVQKTFGKMKEELEARIREWDAADKGTRKNKLQAILDPVIGGDWSRAIRKQKRLHAFGVASLMGKRHFQVSERHLNIVDGQVAAG